MADSRTDKLVRLCRPSQQVEAGRNYLIMEFNLDVIAQGLQLRVASVDVPYHWDVKGGMQDIARVLVYLQ